MNTRIWMRSTGMATLAVALALGSAAHAQSSENQSPANPAPAEDAANAAAGQNNSSGPQNQGQSAAQAQNPDQNEEIVVTAQFREQNLQKTPLAITAVSSAMLEARSETNIAAVADQAPSVTLKPQGAAFGPALIASIRGVGQFDFNPGFEPGVGLYVDDVYYATLTGSIFDLLDLDRVEVLRGPQGTLAGKNSIGGAIKLYSIKPDGTTGGQISATYGSRQRLDLRASADIKLTDDLFARISGVSKSQDGYIKRLDYGCLNPGSGIPAIHQPAEGCVLAKDGDVNYQAARAQLRWVPSKAFEVNLAADYTRDDRHTPGSVLTYANYQGAGFIDPFTGGATPFDSRFLCGKYCNYATFLSAADPAHGYADTSVGEDRSKFIGYGFSGTVDLQLSDRLSLKSITAYRHYDTHFDNDDDFSPLALALGRSYITFHSWSQELRLNGSFGANDLVEYTLGGFYQDQKSNYTTYQELRYAAPGFPAFTGIDLVPASTKAVFAHVQVHATDDLTLIGGIRYTDESKGVTYFRTGPVFASLNGQTREFKGDNVDYRAAIQYQFTPAVMGYVQYSTGFKGGGNSPRPFDDKQVISFGPERLQSYEAGLKTDFFDHKLRFNAAAFFSRYNDIQLTVLTCHDIDPASPPLPCPITRNIGNADIKGVELETTIRPVAGLLIDGSVSYIDFQYRKNAANISALAALGIGPNDTTPFNPKWKWSIGAQYEIPLGDVGSLTPRIDAAYQSAIYTAAANSDPIGANPGNRLPGYAVANARLTYRNTDGDWEISGEVTNLFDKYYFLTSFDLTGAGFGGVSAQPGRPREWALTVKKKF